jgi:hypothetical protein
MIAKVGQRLVAKRGGVKRARRDLGQLDDLASQCLACFGRALWINAAALNDCRPGTVERVANLPGTEFHDSTAHHGNEGGGGSVNYGTNLLNAALAGVKQAPLYTMSAI